MVYYMDEQGFTVNQDDYPAPEAPRDFETDCRAEWRKDDEFRKYWLMRSEKAEQHARANHTRGDVTSL